MAGGPFAQVMACMQCGRRAERTAAGLEDDSYRCEAGHVFRIDWSRMPKPKKPMWTDPKPTKVKRKPKRAG